MKQSKKKINFLSTFSCWNYSLNIQNEDKEFLYFQWKQFHASRDSIFLKKKKKGGGDITHKAEWIHFPF